jgi:HEAT repeat protein
MNHQRSNALEQMKVGDQLEVWEAAKAIVKQQDLSVVVPQLLELMATSPEVERRVAAASVLGSLRSLLALEPLIQILGNRSEPPALRDQAAESLGYLSDPKAREVLITNLSDENADVAFSCAFALRTVGKPDDIPQLEKLTRNTGINSYGAALAQEAREAIEQIRNRASRDSPP